MQKKTCITQTFCKSSNEFGCDAPFKVFLCDLFMCRHNNSCKCRDGNVNMIMHNKGDKGHVEIILVQTHNG